MCCRIVATSSGWCSILPQALSCRGGDRSPDVAWVEQSRWKSLTPEQRQKFPPIAPAFVLELLLPTDRLSVVQAKMQEYMASGVRLGWLIDPSRLHW